MRRILILLLLMFFSSFSIAKNQLFYFEPKESRLEGTVTLMTFPGPPNYESIKNGDRIERGAYLVLKNPIDIDLVPGIEIGNDEPTKNIKILQLAVMNKKDWKKLRKGSYVRIKGTLFRAITGHHRTLVLLEVNELKVISKGHYINNKSLIKNERDQFLIID